MATIHAFTGTHIPPDQRKPDALGLLKYGGVAQKVTAITDGKGARLKRYIDEGKIVDIRALKESEGFSDSDILNVLSESVGSICRLLSLKKYQEVIAFCKLVQVYDIERTLQPKIYGLLEEYAATRPFILDGVHFESMLFTLEQLPESVLSRNECYKLKQVLVEAVVREFSGTLECQKRSASDVVNTYDNFLNFMEATKSLSPTYGLTLKLEVLFSNNYLKDIRVLFGFALANSDFANLKAFFDTVYKVKKIPDKFVAKVFFEILKIADDRNYHREKKLKDFMRETLARFSFPYVRIYEFLRPELQTSEDIDTAQRLFSLSYWERSA